VRGPKRDDAVVDRQAVIDLFLLLEDGFNGPEFFLSQRLEVLRFILRGFLQFGDDLFELANITPEKLKKFSLDFASALLSMFTQVLVSEKDLAGSAGIGSEMEIDAQRFGFTDEIKTGMTASFQEFDVGGIVDGRRDDGRIKDSRSSFDEFLLFEDRKDLLLDENDTLFADARADL